MKEPSRKIILEFLQERPRGKAAVPFVRLCLATVQYHLIRRLKAGHRLPQDWTNPNRSIEGLANDVVGHFLCEKDDPPYPWLFDFLALRGFSEFSDQQLPEIEQLLLSLVFGFTDNTVFKIAREESPELGRTSKAIEAALRLLEKNGEIVTDEIERGARTLIRPAGVFDAHTERQMLPSYDLMLLVAESYACTHNKVALCRYLMKLIGEQDNFQNQFYRHEFLEASRNVISMHARLGAPRLASVPGPIQQLLRQEVESERRNTFERLAGKLVEEQLRKGRITADEVPLLLQAVDRFLQDVCNWACDGLPTYLTEMLPRVSKKLYREDYKYAFETVTSKLREALFESLRKNPIIQKLRYYL